MPVEIQALSPAELLQIIAAVLYLLQVIATRQQLRHNGGRTLRRTRTQIKALFWPILVLKTLSKKLARLAREGQ